MDREQEGASKADDDALKSKEAPELVIASDWPSLLVDLWCRLAPRVVVLPGGDTPIVFFAELGRRANEAGLDFCEILFSDERCVPPTHVDSNFGRAYRALGRYTKATFYRMPVETRDTEAYARVVASKKIDLAVLGLGEDGHTASIFPDSEAARISEDMGGPLVVEVTRDDYTRLTLTPAALCRAETVAFVATGERKRRAVADLVYRRTIPASLVRGRKATYLFCDPAAAEEIRR